MNPNVDHELDESEPTSNILISYIQHYTHTHTPYTHSLGRAVYHGLPDLLTRVAGQELERLGGDISECKVVYLPQVTSHVTT